MAGNRSDTVRRYKNRWGDQMNRILRLGAFAVLCCGLTVTAAQKSEPAPITEASFKCIRTMTPVRGFYVDNLHGDLKGTVAVANSATGGVYPPGSVVQLVPGEVMVKREAGFNAATKDWEFFELDVNDGKSVIRTRGFVDVVNRFGGNCFACHVKAKPEWDLICETGHGCDPIPLTPVMVKALQKTDPRCGAPAELTTEEAEVLKALQAAMTAKPAGT
jgi:hypothetical protein